MTSSFALGALAFKALYAIVRTGSLGVRSSLRHRSYRESWRSKLFTPSSVWGREPWRQSCVRHWAVCGPEGSHQRPYWSLGVKNLSRHCKLLGALVLRACHVTVNSSELWCSELVTSPLAVEVLVFRDVYVAARSWKPWCSDLVLSPLALGSLGVQRLLRCRSLLGALVLRACYVAARSWEPRC